MKRSGLLWLNVIIVIWIFCLLSDTMAQTRVSFGLTGHKGLAVEKVTTGHGETVKLIERRPLFTVEINDTLVSSCNTIVKRRKRGYIFTLGGKIQGSVEVDNTFYPGWKAAVTFKNSTREDLTISNLVPLGQADDHIYITASGPWSLARSKLFRPGLGPIGVILPDNAWELGYSSISISEGHSICALSRRGEVDGAEKQRWKTVLKPGGSVQYVIYADIFQGSWQNGLKMVFQKRYLFDLESFDNHMFQREDLKWIRHKYILCLQFAWDHEFFDAQRGGYRVMDLLDMGERLFGGWDVIGLWPTWPTLGVDQRNQWDLYKDLPGGLEQIRQMAVSMQDRGVRFFVAYNPWDRSTRYVDPYEGMAQLIRITSADGVVLDCKGSSSSMLQAAADGVKPGVIMYSEGMAVPRDMPGIVAGRVHDAIFLPPPLNLNKLIKPDFAIFRVCQLNQGRLHREFAFSFFNGYGIEMNVFGPGRPEWIEEEYLYLGKLVRILRENSSAFLNPNWTPLIPTLKDSVWVNRWPSHEKTIYTILSLRPEGFKGALFEAPFHADSHYISLYHHEEILSDTVNGKTCVTSHIHAFDRANLNTRMEGNVDCIALLPRVLETALSGDSLYFSADRGDKIRIWAGIPSYQGKFIEFSTGSGKVRLMDHFDRYEGKFIVQCLDNETLVDERVVYFKPGTPRLISYEKRTATAVTSPRGMVLIPGGIFTFKISKTNSFIPYPDFIHGVEVTVSPFFMDKTPVTNAQFKEFLDIANYKPSDPMNFLKHWHNGSYPNEKGNYPVVYVSLEDARAYCEWAEKRLPTEKEWQYAAQGKDGRLWPWGSEYDSTRCNHSLEEMTPVDKYPGGESPFGVMDLVGNVWQLTDDVYDNGSHYFIIIRGGSYYNPTSSWWYVKGGPRPLDRSQILLRVSQGFERNATVGFRCVKDSE